MDFTADELEQMFHGAITDRNWDAAEAVLTVLAVRDPRRAQALMDTYRGALALTDLITGDGRRG